MIPKYDPKKNYKPKEFNLIKKRKKLFKAYIKGYFPKEKDCEICEFCIPILKLIEKDILKQDEEFIERLKDKDYEECTCGKVKRKSSRRCRECFKGRTGGARLRKVK